MACKIVASDAKTQQPATGSLLQQSQMNKMSEAFWEPSRSPLSQMYPQGAFCIKTAKPDEVQDLAKEFSTISTVVDMDDAASVTTSTSSSVGNAQRPDSGGRTMSWMMEHTSDIDELASFQTQMSACDRVKAWNTKRDRLEALSQATLAKDFRNLADVSHYSCMGFTKDEDNEIIVTEENLTRKKTFHEELWQTGNWA